MSQIRIREAVASMRVVDGQSLLTDEVMNQIVAAVLQALRCEQRDDASRQRDVSIGGCCDSCDDKAGSGGSLA